MLLDRVKQMLTEKFPEEKISCKTDERNIVTLQGECSDWNTLINIGQRGKRNDCEGSDHSDKRL